MGSTRRGGSTRPPGSNNRQRPTRLRAAEVACSTSGLVEVVSTAPPAAITFGTTMELVLPDLGGPSTRTQCSDGANTGPPGELPRKRPEPQARERARAAASAPARVAAGSMEPEPVGVFMRPSLGCSAHHRSTGGANPARSGGLAAGSDATAPKAPFSAPQRPHQQKRRRLGPETRSGDARREAEIRHCLHFLFGSSCIAGTRSRPGGACEQNRADRRSECRHRPHPRPIRSSAGLDRLPGDRRCPRRKSRPDHRFRYLQAARAASPPGAEPPDGREGADQGVQGHRVHPRREAEGGPERPRRDRQAEVPHRQGHEVGGCRRPAVLPSRPTVGGPRSRRRARPPLPARLLQPRRARPRPRPLLPARRRRRRPALVADTPAATIASVGRSWSSCRW